MTATYSTTEASWQIDRARRMTATLAATVDRAARLAEELNR